MPTRYGQLTLDQKQQIIKTFNVGVECREIPKHLGISERSVSRVLVEAGINTKRRNRYTLDETYFNKIDSQVKSYLLGLLSADGCVTKTNYVSFESVDESLTKLLKAELQYTGETRLIFPKDYAPHYRINFSSKQLACALSRQGVQVGRGKSGLFYFPKTEFLSSYILGYFDGDGCAHANKERSGGSLSIVGSLEFTSEVARLLGMGSIQKHHSKPVYYWRIFSRINIGAFYNLVYKVPSLGLQRKKIKIEQILGSYRRG